jgi:hypothetical protein
VPTNTFLLQIVREYFGFGVEPEIVIVRVDIPVHAVFECVVLQNDTRALYACRDVLPFRHVHVTVVDLNVPLFITYPVLLLVRFRVYLNQWFVFSIIVPSIFGHPDDLTAMWFRSDEAQDVSGLDFVHNRFDRSTGTALHSPEWIPAVAEIDAIIDAD